MSGPEVAKTPGGGAPGKEGKEPVANGHSGEANDVNPFAEYMWMENEEEYNRQVSSFSVNCLLETNFLFKIKAVFKPSVVSILMPVPVSDASFTMISLWGNLLV